MAEEKIININESSTNYDIEMTDDILPENSQSEHEGINLDVVIQFCKDVHEGKIQDKNALQNFLNKIYIQSYLPILEKYRLVIYLSNICLYSEYNELTVLAIEQKKFWNVLLAYTNIVTDGYQDLETVENFDIVFSLLNDLILSVCANDYNRVIKMFDDFNNFNHITSLIDAVNGIDYENLIQGNDVLRTQLQEIEKNKDLISDIVRMNMD